MLQLYSISVSKVLVREGEGREEEIKVISTKPNVSCIFTGSILFTPYHVLTEAASLFWFYRWANWEWRQEELPPKGAGREQHRRLRKTVMRALGLPSRKVILQRDWGVPEEGGWEETDPVMPCFCPLIGEGGGVRWREGKFIESEAVGLGRKGWFQRQWWQNPWLSAALRRPSKQAEMVRELLI